MTWLQSARTNTKVQSAGMIRLAERERDGQQHGRSEQRWRGTEAGAAASSPRARSTEDQIAGVEQPGEERRAGRRADCAGDSSALLLISSAASDRRQDQRRACTGDGQLRTSHRPQAAKAKLATLPNRVALPSLVMWIPACQAARSAAKKKAANAMAIAERSARPVHRLAGTAGRSANRNGRASASRQKPAATGPTPASRHEPGPERQRAAADQQRRKGEADDGSDGPPAALRALRKRHESPKSPANP